jgi:CDP-paratose 2-epimerase
MDILVTGGAGLVGSECCRLFAEQGHSVTSVDNYTRGELFGEEGDTESTIDTLLQDYSIDHHQLDIRDDEFLPLLDECDAVVHTAAQPSHPKSIETPIEDFQINASATLRMLEHLRKHNDDATVVFCSTNKVYGEIPNYYAYDKVGKRFEPEDPTLRDGFDESTSLDRSSHTPFGVSKVAADLYVQEYARLYNLNTGVFRMGCITGGAARAVEMHNWEPFFVKKALTGDSLSVFGYSGYQVRDVIHARDLARLFAEFLREPRSGEVYNVGGGRDNSISLLESFDLIEDITGQSMNYELAEGREADHQWWISDISKAKNHYDWDIEIGLESIFQEIYESLRDEV